MALVFSFTHVTNISWDGANWTTDGNVALINKTVTGNVESSDVDNSLDFGGTVGRVGNDSVSLTSVSDTNNTTGIYPTSINSYNGQWTDGSVNGMIIRSDAWGSYKLVTDGATSLSASETFTGDWSTASFAFCFLEGTMIATPTGETPVEMLEIGTPILTADGREIPVKWVGQQRIWNHGLCSPKKAPVCIEAGALGAVLPHTDLYVTSDHGMIVDGLVINAGALVNHKSIRFVSLSEMPEVFTYFHIETEAHDEVCANGAPAETFIDYSARRDFDNYQEYLDLYGCERIVPEMDRIRVSAQRQLPDDLVKRLGIRAYDKQLDDEMAQLEDRLVS